MGRRSLQQAHGTGSCKRALLLASPIGPMFTTTANSKELPQTAAQQQWKSNEAEAGQNNDNGWNGLNKNDQKQS